MYGRLISETAGKEKKNYTYDLSGNRTRLTVSENKNYNTYYNYDVYNRLTRETTNEKVKAERTDNNYYYDFNGNQTLVTYNNVGDYNSSSADKPFKISARLKLAGNSEERSYNGFNELTHISGNNNVSLTYRPDGLLFKNNNNYYAWQGDNIIYEFGTYYTRGLGLIKASTGLYYLQNGHGDISALAKENGTVSTRYMYDAFGNSSYTGEYSDNLFKYCGEYEDSSLGGIYLRARIYNPGTGRFTTEDPARDGMNWYAYCGNSPIMFVDPFGMFQRQVSLEQKEIFKIQNNQEKMAQYYLNYLENQAYLNDNMINDDELKNLIAIKKDLLSKASKGVLFDLEIYSQGSSGNCWCYQNAAILNYWTKKFPNAGEYTKIRSQKDAEQYAKRLTGGKNQKGGYTSTKTIKINNITDLFSAFEKYGPLGVRYGVPGGEYHIISINGAISIEGYDPIVLTGNPWNEDGDLDLYTLQTFKDFKSFMIDPYTFKNTGLMFDNVYVPSINKTYANFNN